MFVRENESAYVDEAREVADHAQGLQTIHPICDERHEQTYIHEVMV